MEISLLSNIGHYIPELLIILTMLGLLLLESTYRLNESGRTYVFVSSYIGLLLALIACIMNFDLKAVSIFTHAVVIDPFSTFLKMIMILGAAATIFLNKVSKDISPHLKSEFNIITMGVLVGGMLLASAYNMLTLYLGIEMLSILSYAMASLKKHQAKSNEAGLKYALYGGISAGIMLFGISHIYGVLGTIQFHDIVSKIGLLKTTQWMVILPSFVCFFVGIGYKLASVPFHMWAPDVYEGSPYPVTTFFALVPKIAAIGALVRVTFVFFELKGPMQDSWVGLLQIIAALTMTVGNITAINQRSVKRMLAYSSIAHAGTMMLGVVVIDKVGVTAILFYGVVYLFMTLVAFYVTSFVSDEYGNDHFERFNGLAKRYPLMAILLSLSLFSLAGLPPLGGFVAKFHIISAVIAKEYYVLAFIAVMNSVISLYYYLRLSRIMVFKEPESVEKIEGFNFLNQLVTVALSLPFVLLGIFWGGVMSLAARAGIFIN